MSTSRTNGRPEPEVIMNYGDGFSYSKGKMEEAYRTGGILDRTPPKPAKDSSSPAVKKEDIDLIVHEFEIPRARAEKILAENEGDISRALRALVAV